MAAIFQDTIQPSIFNLFSSTSSQPLQLASCRSSADFAEDAFIALVRDHDDTKEEVISSSIGYGSKGKEVVENPLLRKIEEDRLKLVARPSYFREGEVSEEGVEGVGGDRGDLGSLVLHIQSPNVRTTYVSFPPSSSTLESEEGKGESKYELGITLPYLHLQVKNLGQAFMLETVISDDRGRKGRIRLATFQTSARLYPSDTPDKSPLLVLPLHFPPLSGPATLTAWTTVTLHFPSLIPHFASASLIRSPETGDSDLRIRPRPRPSPLGRFVTLDELRIHANCRLRRVVCANDNLGGMSGRKEEYNPIRERMEVVGDGGEGYQGSTTGYDFALFGYVGGRADGH